MLADDNTGGEQDPPPLRATPSSARIALGEIVVVAPGVIHCRVPAYVRLDTLERIIAAADEQLRQGHRPRVFIDSAETERYDIDVRKVLQDWVLDNRTKIEGIWVLYSSPLIKIGTSLASAFTGGAFHGYDDIEKFDEELDAAISNALAATRPT
jgi:hypothetical protein